MTISSNAACSEPPSSSCAIAMMARTLRTSSSSSTPKSIGGACSATYMDLHWEVLLVHLLNFRWAYPSERENVPRWLMDELIVRLKQQLDLPSSRVKICRGRIFSEIDYEVAVKEWGFAD